MSPFLGLGFPMNDVIFEAFGLVITPWKLIGYFGVLLFSGRWVVKLLYSTYYKRPVLPTIFWYMSIAGSLALLSYFTFGKNDSVGILSNLFPALVASYNLYLDVKKRRSRPQAARSA
jgi:lipid-A-disaccharide synthase-like uncharacterized protein